ncbi:MAG TPA: ABC transporter permease [Egibacteraceae bacterium]|nr:ABC transporter permease [Egibacteraceae bacterium]
MSEEIRERTPRDAAVEGHSQPGGSGGPPPPADSELDATYREGLRIEARSQWQLFRRRFVTHKLAMVSLFILLIICGAALFADRVAPYGFEQIDLGNRSKAPTLEDNHFFGTDKIGRDYFSRVLYGTGTSVRVAFFVAFLSTAIGTVVGALAGYYRGWLDNVLMRFVDFLLAVPFLAVLLVAAAFLGRGSPYRVATIIALLLWTTIARIVRGQYLSLREKEFVEAARASGASDARIIFRHMLPNTFSPIIVNATLTVALAILLEATLSFLGFGIQPPTPALGKLIDDGKGAMLTDWWLVTMPGLMIVTICLCINFIGDGLRDALDPTQSER